MFGLFYILSVLVLLLEFLDNIFSNISDIKLVYYIFCPILDKGDFNNILNCKYCSTRMDSMNQEASDTSDRKKSQLKKLSFNIPKRVVTNSRNSYFRVGQDLEKSISVSLAKVKRTCHSADRKMQTSEKSMSPGRFKALLSQITLPIKNNTKNQEKKQEQDEIIFDQEESASQILVQPIQPQKTTEKLTQGMKQSSSAQLQQIYDKKQIVGQSPQKQKLISEQQTQQNSPQPQKNPKKQKKQKKRQSLQSQMPDYKTFQIKRNKQWLNKIWPQFNVFTGQKNQYCFSAKLVSNHLESTYLICQNPNSQNFVQNGSRYLGKVKGNFFGNVFNIYGPGYNPSDFKNKKEPLRELLATIKYQLHFYNSDTRPRNFKVFALRNKAKYYELQGAYAGEQQTPLSQLIDRGNNKSKILVMQNRKPIWNQTENHFILLFEGRAKRASIKNFILEDQENHKVVRMLFTKMDDDQFRLDVCDKLSPVVAFGIALSTFGGKIGCQ